MRGVNQQHGAYTAGNATPPQPIVCHGAGKRVAVAPLAVIAEHTRQMDTDIAPKSSSCAWNAAACTNLLLSKAHTAETQA